MHGRGHPPQARGQGPGDVRFRRGNTAATPQEALFRNCSRSLKKGRETQAQAVGPWLLKSRPFSPRGCPRDPRVCTVSCSEGQSTSLGQVACRSPKLTNTIGLKIQRRAAPHIQKRDPREAFPPGQLQRGS